jgi:hypothetical protein
MTQQQYDDIWHDADRVRSFIEQCARSAPELFPAGFDQGYRLHGFGRESRKLQFRVEAQNLLNHMNAGQPDGGLGNRTFGMISTQSGLQRRVMAALKLTF